MNPALRLGIRGSRSNVSLKIFQMFSESLR
jgi:hypothetical protein